MNHATDNKPISIHGKAARFTRFISYVDVQAWHVLDEWVQDAEGQLCPYLDDQLALRLTWMESRKLRHSGKEPATGQRILMLDRLPGEDGQRPFDTHLYRVAGSDNPLGLPTSKEQLLLIRVSGRMCQWNEAKRWFEWVD